MKHTTLAVACAAVLGFATGCNTASYVSDAEVMAAVEARTAAASSTAVKTPEPECPTTIKYLGHTKGTPPYRDYFFDIKITNHTDKPRWYVFRNNADVPLSNDEIFSSDSPNLIPFKNDRLDSSSAGGNGRTTRVVFKGKHSFIAFRLLPKATVMIDRFKQIAQGNYDHFEVWEASDILVNSNTPLEEWLPYNVMSDMNVRITKEKNTVQLDLNRKGTRQRTDYPKEKILHLWVQREHEWSIPIGPVR